MVDTAADGYDVFLSYSTADHAAVEAVAQSLRKRNLGVFLDRWYLAPGQSWVTKLEKLLYTCRSVAVFLGPAGLGPWQQRERDLALDRQGRDAAFPVIPVLLPGAGPALGFLRLNTWVDLRDALDDPLALDILTAAVRGQSPGPDQRERVLQTLATLCPYRGLLPFREEDAAFFCGRETYTKTLVQAVEKHRLVAVVGASGSGKSSVVMAGLVPALRELKSGEPVWEVASLVPQRCRKRSAAASPRGGDAGTNCGRRRTSTSSRSRRDTAPRSRLASRREEHRQTFMSQRDA